jgi:hypothetical protein
MDGKHPQLTGHTRRAPIVEIRYTEFPKASVETTGQQRYKTNHSAYGLVIICNRKQGYYSDHRICEMMTLNEIYYNLSTSNLMSIVGLVVISSHIRRLYASNQLGDVHTINS